MIEVEKENLKQQVFDKLNEICPNDFSKCTIPGCRFLQRCNKPELNPVGKQFLKLKRLRAYKRHIDKEYYRFKGRKNPTNFGNSILERASELVGNVFEHELIKDSAQAKRKLKNAKSMGQILKIFDEMYFIKNGKMPKSYGK